MKKHWYDYLWIWTICYFALGFFNILFAWLGMIDFLVPLFIAIIGGSKAFCNRYCGRGQLLQKCGTCSRKTNAPRWLSHSSRKNRRRNKSTKLEMKMEKSQQTTQKYKGS